MIAVYKTEKYIISVSRNYCCLAMNSYIVFKVQYATVSISFVTLNPTIFSNFTAKHLPNRNLHLKLPSFKLKNCNNKYNYRYR